VEGDHLTPTLFLEQVDHLEHLANMLKKPKVFKMTNMTEMIKVLTFLEGSRLDAVPWRRGQRVAQAL